MIDNIRPTDPAIKSAISYLLGDKPNNSMELIIIVDQLGQNGMNTYFFKVCVSIQQIFIWTISLIFIWAFVKSFNE